MFAQCRKQDDGGRRRRRGRPERLPIETKLCLPPHPRARPPPSKPAATRRPSAKTTTRTAQKTARWRRAPPPTSYLATYATRAHQSATLPGRSETCFAKPPSRPPAGAAAGGGDVSLTRTPPYSSRWTSGRACEWCCCAGRPAPARPPWPTSWRGTPATRPAKSTRPTTGLPTPSAKVRERVLTLCWGGSSTGVGGFVVWVYVLVK
jgi:hypothetical protein